MTRSTGLSLALATLGLPISCTAWFSDSAPSAHCASIGPSGDGGQVLAILAEDSEVIRYRCDRIWVDVDGCGKTWLRLEGNRRSLSAPSTDGPSPVPHAIHFNADGGFDFIGLDPAVVESPAQ
jgi:hypothetical protein